MAADRSLARSFKFLAFSTRSVFSATFASSAVNGFFPNVTRDPHRSTP